MLSVPRALVPAVVLWCVVVVAPASGASLSAASPEIITHNSDLLSRFWGRQVDMQAAAYVPPRCRQRALPCAVLYHLPGYGGSVATAWSTVAEYVRPRTRVPRLALAHPVLDPRVHGRR